MSDGPIPTEARCALHEAPASAICSRCGRFLCDDCLPDLSISAEDVCPECLDRLGVPAPRPISKLLWVFLGLVALGALQKAVATAVLLGLAMRFVGVRLFVNQELLERTEGWVQLLWTLVLLGLVVLALAALASFKFLQRRRSTRPLMIALLSLWGAYPLAAYALFQNVPALAEQSSLEVAWLDLALAIPWILYWAFSTRVRETFVL